MEERRFQRGGTVAIIVLCALAAGYGVGAEKWSMAAMFGLFTVGGLWSLVTS